MPNVNYGNAGQVNITPGAGGRTVADVLDPRGLRDQYWKDLYSIESITATTTGQEYFGRDNPTLAQGNYPEANKMPRWQSFQVWAVGVYIPAAVLMVSHALLQNGCMLTVKVNDTVKLDRTPIWKLPAGGGPHGSDNTATTSSLANGVPSPQFAAWFPKPLRFEIGEEERYSARLEMTAALTGLVTTNVWVVFSGIQRRKPTT